MSLSLPRKRTILAIHRWLGLAAALFLVVVSLTGLALNHTERLGLDRILLRNDFILERYGMVGAAALRAYAIPDGDVIVHIGGRLFYNDRPVGSGGEPLGFVDGDPMAVLATAGALFYLTPEGELIERVGVAQLPYGQLIALGRDASGAPVLVAENGSWKPDSDWFDFSVHEGAYTVDPLAPADPDAALESAILEDYQGAGVPLYRVLLDLHSGRLFGWGGRTLMDLSAVAVLLLVSSGIMGWLRKSRRPVNNTLS